MDADIFSRQAIPVLQANARQLTTLDNLHKFLKAAWKAKNAALCIGRVAPKAYLVHVERVHLLSALTAETLLISGFRSLTSGKIELVGHKIQAVKMGFHLTA